MARPMPPTPKTRVPCLTSFPVAFHWPVKVNPQPPTLQLPWDCYILFITFPPMDHVNHILSGHHSVSIYKDWSGIAGWPAGSLGSVFPQAQCRSLPQRQTRDRLSFRPFSWFSLHLLQAGREDAWGCGMDLAVSGSFPSPLPGVAPPASPWNVNLTLVGTHRRNSFQQLKSLIPYPLEILALGFWQEGLFAYQVSMNKDFFLPFCFCFLKTRINGHCPQSSFSRDSLTPSPNYLYFLFWPRVWYFVFLFSCETTKKIYPCKIWEPDQFWTILSFLKSVYPAL